MTSIRIVPSEELSKEMLAVAAEDAAPALPDLPDSRSLKNTGTGMSAVRAWEESEPGPMQYVVAGLVPRGHHAGVFGDGGSGKSLLAIYLGFCVVTNRPVFGRAVERTNVLLLDFEMEQSEFLRRGYRVARGMGLTAIPQGIHYVQATRPLTDESTLASCVEMGRDTQSGLVIVDSFAPASCASDQVAPSEVIPFIQRLRQLGTVLLLDHVPKPVAAAASAPPLRAYGSTYKHNLIRSSLRLERGKAGGMRLTQMKNNFGPLANPITFVMTHTFDAVSFDLVDPSDERLAGLAERTRTVPERILDELRQCGEEGASAERLAQLLGCSKKTISNQLSQLRQRKRVQPADFGRWRVPDFPDSIGNLPGIGRREA